MQQFLTMAQPELHQDAAETIDNTANRLSTDIRENIFSQIFENVVSITGRPIRFLMFMPFKCKRLKTVIHREYSGLLLRLLDLRRQYREPFGLTSRYRPPPSASL